MAKRAAQKVAELWRLHRAQRFIFKTAMREELPGDLRDLCGKGYLIASLCMNEISAIYNHLKSPVEDDLLQFPAEEIAGLFEIPGKTSAEHLIRYLKDKQHKLLKKYTKLLEHFEETETNRVLKDHIFVLERLTEKLKTATD